MFGVSAFGLVAALVATLWFFWGFYETDPDFSPASAAFLLAFGLGGFAIIPTAVLMRLSWSAWRGGFRTPLGLWAIFLALPWIGLAIIAARAVWLPIWLTIIPLAIACLAVFWASLSLVLLHVKRR